MALKLLNHEYISSFFIWGAGSIIQQDWSVVTYLLPRLTICAVLVALLARPLIVLTLSDESANALDVSLRFLRLSTLFVAVLLTSFVTSAVGIIGFIGLASPHIARLAGARRLQERLFLSPLIGAGLLLLVDQAVQTISGAILMVAADWVGRVVIFPFQLPAGLVAGLIWVPYLIWHLTRREG